MLPWLKGPSQLTLGIGIGTFFVSLLTQSFDCFVVGGILILIGLVFFRLSK